MVLVAFIVKLDAVGGWLSSVISAFKPLLIGFAVAFVLNRPCNYFAGLYGKKLPEKAAKADTSIRMGKETPRPVKAVLPTTGIWPI